MSIPTRQQFSALFENPASSAVQRAKTTLFIAYPAEMGGYDRQSDYLVLFRLAFEIILDHQEGIFSLLEQLTERLPPEQFQIDFDEGYETATVNFAGRSSRFHDASLDDESFDAELAQLQQLTADQYVFRLFFDGGISDALSFLVVPADTWAHAEAQYGSARLSACFKDYGDTVALDIPYDATLRWRVPQRKSERTIRKFPLLLITGIGIIVFLYYAYSFYTRDKAIASMSCESQRKTYGKLPPEQANVLLEEMRKRAICK